MPKVLFAYGVQGGVFANAPLEPPRVGGSPSRDTRDVRTARLG